MFTQTAHTVLTIARTWKHPRGDVLPRGWAAEPTAALNPRHRPRTWRSLGSCDSLPGPQRTVLGEETRVQGLRSAPPSFQPFWKWSDRRRAGPGSGLQGCGVRGYRGSAGSSRGASRVPELPGTNVMHECERNW